MCRLLKFEIVSFVKLELSHSNFYIQNCKALKMCRLLKFEIVSLVKLELSHSNLNKRH